MIPLSGCSPVQRRARVRGLQAHAPLWRPVDDAGGAPAYPVEVSGPVTSPSDYRRRRQRVGQQIGDGVLLLYGGNLRTRSNDTEYRFRPDSDFHYLTGLAEPGGVLVLRPGRDPETILFVRPRDAEAEVWSGRRVGPEGAIDRFGADAAHPLEELPAKLPELIDGAPVLHAPVGRYRGFDQRVLTAIDKLRRRNRWGETPPEGIMDARIVLGEDRMVKDDAAVRSLRHAVDLSAQAHVEAMGRVRPGMHEYEIEALIEYHFRRNGSGGSGYGSIVGGGDNATILHYVENTAPLVDGEILLVDAGCEWELFSGDITRSYPVNGKFTPAQRAVYDIVLEANETGVSDVTVDNDIDSIHHKCIRILCEGLRELGLVEGTVDEIFDEEKYERFYMHRTSHWLGADVHDAGKYTLERRPRPLRPGFVLTVEPGLYFSAADESIPPEFRGIGIRIEDDVLVTADGPDVLSHAVPKRPQDVESLVGSLNPTR